MLVERAFARIVGRRLLEHQGAHGLSDEATARLARVSQSYWWRVKRGLTEPGAPDGAAVGERLLSGLAASMPELVRAAVDEVQAMKRAEREWMSRGRAPSGGRA